MAIAFVQQTSYDLFSSETSIAKAYASNNTAGNLLIACCTSGDGGNSITGITDTQGNTWTKYAQRGTTNVNCSIWYTANCAAGANTVTASYPGGIGWKNLHISEFSGMATSSVTNGTNGGTAYAITCTTGSITTTTADCLLIGCGVTSLNAVTISTASGWTSLGARGYGRPGHAQYKIVSSTGSYTSTSSWAWTGSNGQIETLIAAFKIGSSSGNRIRRVLVGA